MEFDYTITTTKDFDSTVKSIEAEIAKAGMRVLYVHDVQKTLAEKGFQREPFKIVEFCNAKFANEFLNMDIKIGLCLPCKINVYIKDGQTFIRSRIPRSYEDERANELAEGYFAASLRSSSFPVCGRLFCRSSFQKQVWAIDRKRWPYCSRRPCGGRVSPRSYEGEAEGKEILEKLQT